MIEKTGEIIGIFFKATGNLGLTVIITACIMYTIKVIANIVLKRQKEALKISYEKEKTKDNKQQRNFNIQINKDGVFYIIYNVLYFLIAVAVFAAIIGAADYIPGVDKNKEYPFLFLKDILHNEIVWLPTAFAVISTFLKNILQLKETFVDNFTSTILGLSLFIILVSLYTFFFGPIYLIYLITQNILSAIYHVAEKIIKDRKAAIS